MPRHYKRKRPAFVPFMDKPLNSQVGAIRQLHALIKREQLNVADLLETAGYEPHTLYRAFSGRNSPRITTIEEIANAIGYTLRLVPRE